MLLIALRTVGVVVDAVLLLVLLTGLCEGFGVVHLLLLPTAHTKGRVVGGLFGGTGKNMGLLVDCLLLAVKQMKAPVAVGQLVLLDTQTKKMRLVLGWLLLLEKKMKGLVVDRQLPAQQK